MSAAERLQRLDQHLSHALRLAGDLGIDPATVLTRMHELMDVSARPGAQHSPGPGGRTELAL
jgi:hypothetical protein